MTFKNYGSRNEKVLGRTHLPSESRVSTSAPQLISKSRISTFLKFKAQHMTTKRNINLFTGFREIRTLQTDKSENLKKSALVIFSEQVPKKTLF